MHKLSSSGRRLFKQYMSNKHCIIVNADTEISGARVIITKCNNGKHLVMSVDSLKPGSLRRGLTIRGNESSPKEMYSNYQKTEQKTKMAIYFGLVECILCFLVLKQTHRDDRNKAITGLLAYLVPTHVYQTDLHRSIRRHLQLFLSNTRISSFENGSEILQ